MILKIVFGIFSFLLLIYLVLPGPTVVESFPEIPQSLKSDEPGDTVQVPNTKAYFSGFFRSWVVPFYQKQYQELTLLPFVPLRLNYPPELAFGFVRDQVKSTYLEELVYPLRDSVFINGFEPFYENGRPRYKGALPIEIGNTTFDTKTTLRFYPSPLWARIAAWLGIVVSLGLLGKLGRRIIFHD